ncbi:MAG TPA: Ig-like domain-containing protein, partial [Cyclobacteriaceae bacterium]
QQMVLLGDPALKLFGPGKPDVSITDTDIAAIGFDDKPVTALADSFALKMIVKNFGVITKDVLKIKVTRKFSDNTSVTYDSVFAQPYTKDTLTFVIRQTGIQGFGNNVFTVSLDPDKTIDEFNEENNIGTLSLFIPLSGTRNLFPTAFSIVSKTDAQLVFQNTNLLSGARSYVIELDTTGSFSSPFIQRFNIDGKVLLKQKVKLLAKDSTVYYWRTKLAQPAADENTEWQVTSFAYISGSPEGWAQMKFPQFSDDAALGLIKDPVLQNLKFTETSTDLFIKTFGKDNTSLPTDAALNINGVDYWHSIQGFNCRDNTINLIAFNKNTVVPYQGIPFTWQNSGGRACGREPQLINSFLTGEAETGLGDDLIQYVDNIHSSDSVLLFTLGDAGLTSWSVSLKNKLGEFGISVAQIDALLPGEPVIIFGRKGASPGTAKIIRTTLTPESEQELVVNETLTGKLSSGLIRSTVIGPANSWKNFVSQVTEKSSNDEVRFDLYGIKLDGTEELIQSDIGNEFDLSGVPAGTYPQLKLVYFTKDEIDLTAAQLKKWFVFFDPVAEGFLVYKGSPTQQTFDEGQSWTGSYSFVNISERSFTDSLYVEVGFFNKAKRILERKDVKINAPVPGDSTQFQISTIPLVGLNDVNVFVNHRVRAELYYENNTLNLIDYLNVLPDKTSPVLDVSIDGRYVQNGDFVSSNPSINILLKDENQFLYKADTMGIDVLLKSPCITADCSFTRINLSGTTVKWSPATSTTDFKIAFNPKDLPDGEYTLRVQAEDVAGNKAGSEPFEVTFNVLGKTLISFVPAFPNPSAGDFFFRFLLTGQYAMEKFNLQIWSSGGQLISSFTESDLNEFHVGTHELKWGGLDIAGNLIQPGVYIYRMEVGANGKSATTHGKLVVIR